MPKKLGTFLGVYTPTILTILGVIMYLRFGWLVGQLGLFNILVIVVLAHVITFATTLSFSSVATNGRVGPGGAYYIISRSLGLEIGGAIGIPLFLSQAFSITLYAFGLAESLRFVFPALPLQPVTCGIILVVALISLFGAEMALRTQVPLMILVGLSILAFGVGVVLTGDPGTVEFAGGGSGLGFWAGFAIFFPAVTGAMAGLGLSGELADPMKSIPRGALLAVVTGFIVYLLVPLGLSMAVTGQVLRDDPMVWSRVAAGGAWLVLPGLWSAIFSSAVGSVLGAPRTLEALARDGLAPSVFVERGLGLKGTVPGLALTTALALGVVALGDLNAVATFVSMFFLTVYGAVNLVAAFEAVSGDSSWRPQLKVPWWVSLLGGLGCLVTMLLIDPVVGPLAVGAELLLFMWLSRHEKAASWGDARRGLYESLIRWALIRLAERPASPRNWRPHTLVFVQDPDRDMDLVRFASWFSSGKGVVTTCRLLVGDVEMLGGEREGQRREMAERFAAEKIVVFSEVDVVDNVVDGLVGVAQANGMAGLASNTVMVGWPSDPILQAEFMRVQRKLSALGKSFIVGRIKPRTQFGMLRRRRQIHVWWGGLQRNGDILLLLAYLLSLNPGWRDAQVCILSLASTETMRARTTDYLRRMLDVVRIDADFRVLLKPEGRLVRDLVQEMSRDADVVLLGLAPSKEGAETEAAQRLESLAGDLPCVFFVHNASLFTGDLLDGGEFEDVEEVVRPVLPPDKLPGDMEDEADASKPAGE